MKIVIVIALALMLAACGTVRQPLPEVRTITNTVKVPVPCNPKKPARPASAVDALPLDAEIDDQMRALRADRVRGKAYEGQLEKALDSCASATM